MENKARFFLELRDKPTNEALMVYLDEICESGADRKNHNLSDKAGKKYRGLEVPWDVVALAKRNRNFSRLNITIFMLPEGSEHVQEFKLGTERSLYRTKAVRQAVKGAKEILAKKAAKRQAGQRG